MHSSAHKPAVVAAAALAHLPMALQRRARRAHNAAQDGMVVAQCDTVKPVCLTECGGQQSMLQTYSRIAARVCKIVALLPLRLRLCIEELLEPEATAGQRSSDLLPAFEVAGTASRVCCMRECACPLPDTSPTCCPSLQTHLCLCRTPCQYLHGRW